MNRNQFLFPVWHLILYESEGIPMVSNYRGLNRFKYQFWWWMAAVWFFVSSSPIFGYQLFDTLSITVYMIETPAFFTPLFSNSHTTVLSVILVIDSLMYWWAQIQYDRENAFRWQYFGADLTNFLASCFLLISQAMYFWAPADESDFFGWAYIGYWWAGW